MNTYVSSIPIGILGIYRFDLSFQFLESNNMIAMLDKILIFNGDGTKNNLQN